MMSFKEAEDLLKKHISDPTKIGHMYKCAEYAERLAKRINRSGKAKVDVAFIKICALLHDIGRSDLIPKDEHVYAGGRLMRELGHPHIAEVIETHLWGHELNQLLGRKVDLRPKTVEQKIIAYVDMRIGPNGELFSPEKRVEEIIKRHKDSPTCIECMHLSEERRRKLIEEVEALL